MWLMLKKRFAEQFSVKSRRKSESSFVSVPLDGKIKIESQPD
jgi:hypothetical protein